MKARLHRYLHARKRACTHLCIERCRHKRQEKSGETAAQPEQQLTAFPRQEERSTRAPKGVKPWRPYD